MTGAPGPTIEYDPTLLEESVLLAVRGHADERSFDREREQVYERRADQDERDALFVELSRAWFRRLGLAEALEIVMLEYPTLVDGVDVVSVGRARARKEEEAELYVAAGGAHARGGRRVRVRALAATVARPERFRELLRHELCHVHDMLDPDFGYSPDLELAETGAAPAVERLIRERYRAQWDASIDGRIARHSAGSGALRATRLADFAGCFPFAQSDIERAFTRYFDSPRPTHAEMRAVALDPDLLPGGAPSRHHAGQCPLCSFPIAALQKTFSDEVTRRILSDFPGWYPEQGACPQCAELYRSAHLSQAAAEQLPRSAL